MLVFNWTLVWITLFLFARWTNMVVLEWKPTFFPRTLIYFCQSIIPAGAFPGLQIPQYRIPGLRKGIQDCNIYTDWHNFCHTAAIQLLSLFCLTYVVGCPCSNVVNTLVWRFFTRRWIIFRLFLWITSQFHHGILEPPMKIVSLPVRTDVFKYLFFPRTITDWNSLPLPVRLLQSTQSFHGALQNSSSSNRCWLSWHSGGNGWSAPIAGHRIEEPKTKQSLIQTGLTAPAETRNRKCFSMQLILVVGKVDMINHICQMLSFCWKLLSAYFA